jgi:hypothetical protein
MLLIHCVQKLTFCQEYIDIVQFCKLAQNRTSHLLSTCFAASQFLQKLRVNFSLRTFKRLLIERLYLHDVSLKFELVLDETLHLILGLCREEMFFKVLPCQHGLLLFLELLELVSHFLKISFQCLSLLQSLSGCNHFHVEMNYAWRTQLNVLLRWFKFVII